VDLHVSILCYLRRCVKDSGQNLAVFYVPFVPGVPDHDIGPIMSPGHGEKIEAAIFKQFHPVVFYSDLGVGGARPVPQVALRVAIPHDHYVQGLGGPKVADGHSVQGNAGRF